MVMIGAKQSDELLHSFIRDFWNTDCDECRKKMTVGYAGYEGISMRNMVISNQTLSVQGRLIACAESIVKCVI